MPWKSHTRVKKCLRRDANSSDCERKHFSLLSSVSGTLQRRFLKSRKICPICSLARLWYFDSKEILCTVRGASTKLIWADISRFYCLRKYFWSATMYYQSFMNIFTFILYNLYSLIKSYVEHMCVSEWSFEIRVSYSVGSSPMNFAVGKVETHRRNPSGVT